MVTTPPQEIDIDASEALKVAEALGFSTETQLKITVNINNPDKLKALMPSILREIGLKAVNNQYFTTLASTLSNGEIGKLPNANVLIQYLSDDKINKDSKIAVLGDFAEAVFDKKLSLSELSNVYSKHNITSTQSQAAPPAAVAPSNFPLLPPALVETLYNRSDADLGWDFLGWVRDGGNNAAINSAGLKGSGQIALAAVLSDYTQGLKDGSFKGKSLDTEHDAIKNLASGKIDAKKIAEMLGDVYNYRSSLMKLEDSEVRHKAVQRATGYLLDAVSEAQGIEILRELATLNPEGDTNSIAQVAAFIPDAISRGLKSSPLVQYNPIFLFGGVAALSTEMKEYLVPSQIEDGALQSIKDPSKRTLYKYAANYFTIHPDKKDIDYLDKDALEWTFGKDWGSAANAKNLLTYMNRDVVKNSPKYADSISTLAKDNPTGFQSLLKEAGDKKGSLLFAAISGKNTDLATVKNLINGLEEPEKINFLSDSKILDNKNIIAYLKDTTNTEVANKVIAKVAPEKWLSVYKDIKGDIDTDVKLDAAIKAAPAGKGYEIFKPLHDTLMQGDDAKKALAKILESKDLDGVKYSKKAEDEHIKDLAKKLKQDAEAEKPKSSNLCTLLFSLISDKPEITKMLEGLFGGGGNSEDRALKEYGIKDANNDDVITEDEIAAYLGSPEGSVFKGKMDAALKANPKASLYGVLKDEYTANNKTRLEASLSEENVKSALNKHEIDQVVISNTNTAVFVLMKNGDVAKPDDNTNTVAYDRARNILTAGYDFLTNVQTNGASKIEKPKLLEYYDKLISSLKNNGVSSITIGGQTISLNNMTLTDEQKVKVANDLYNNRSRGIGVTGFEGSSLEDAFPAMKINIQANNTTYVLDTELISTTKQRSLARDLVNSGQSLPIPNNHLYSAISKSQTKS